MQLRTTICASSLLVCLAVCIGSGNGLSKPVSAKGIRPSAQIKAKPPANPSSRSQSSSFSTSSSGRSSQTSRKGGGSNGSSSPSSARSSASSRLSSGRGLTTRGPRRGQALLKKFAEGFEECSRTAATRSKKLFAEGATKCKSEVRLKRPADSKDIEGAAAIYEDRYIKAYSASMDQALIKLTTCPPALRLSCIQESERILDTTVEKLNREFGGSLAEGQGANSSSRVALATDEFKKCTALESDRVRHEMSSMLYQCLQDTGIKVIMERIL